MPDLAFVTGATGFVGANLARFLLKKGLRVRVLVRKESNRQNLEGLDVEPFEGDLRDQSSLERACQGARYVFNVAADYRIWVPDPEAMYASNVDGTKNIITAAVRARAERIVHCSSVAAIPPPAGEVPSDERVRYESPDAIIGVYKKSKWLSEVEALRMANDGAPVVIVNPAAPIGPYDIKPTPTGKIVLDFLRGKMPSYVDTGLNVVHVRDVAEGHWLAATKGELKERYILGGENLYLKEILDILSEETGLPAPRFKTPYAVAWIVGALDSARLTLFGGTPMAPLDAVRMARYRMFYDPSKARSKLGLPRTPARRALLDAARWFVENRYAPAYPRYKPASSGAAV